MAIVEIIRALVRPLSLMGWLGGGLVLLLTGKPVPDWWIALGSAWAAWWFADRARR